MCTTCISKNLYKKVLDFYVNCRKPSLCIFLLLSMSQTSLENICSFFANEISRSILDYVFKAVCIE